MASESYAIMVDVDPESLEPTITLPDGSVTHSFDAYADVVAQIYETNPAAEFIIGFGPVLDAQIAADLDETGERWQTTVGSYFIHAASHTAYVGGCIRQNRTHYDVHINQGSTMRMSLHLLAYTSGGRVCLGAYESVSQFCVSWCSPTYTQVRNTIRDAIIAVGITYAIAEIIAYAVTPIAIGALAL